MYHITTEQIETFLTLVQNRNYRKTSEILFITQPTATKHIQKLEKELGMSLFRRSTQNVTLTESGSRLAEIWSPLYRRFTEAIDEVKFITTKNKNELTIGILRDYRSQDTADLLLKMFKDYLQKHEIPSIPLIFRFFSMREQREALRNHQVDFSFSLGFDHDSLHHIETMNLSRKRIFALLPSEHPLAKKNILSVQELENETVIILSSAESSGINKVTVSILQKYLPKVKIETVPNFQSMAFALKYRNGITLGNHLFINEHDFVEIPVMELKNAGYEETLTWRTDDMSISKMIFLNFAKEYAEKLC
jgi:DNA-binding transcriptional LysR family regulator